MAPCRKEMIKNASGCRAYQDLEGCIQKDRSCGSEFAEEEKIGMTFHCSSWWRGGGKWCCRECSHRGKFFALVPL